MIELKVAGMTCAHCVKSITQAVQGADPNASVDVDLKGGWVRVESGLSRSTLESIVREEGYEVSPP